MSLQNHSSHLEEFVGNLLRLNEDYNNDYVKPANDHAMTLNTKAIQLER